MAAMRQDDRSSIHIRLQGTLFPNISSQLKGTGRIEKLETIFAFLNSRCFSAHGANLPKPLSRILCAHRAHVLSQAMQQIMRSVLKQTMLLPERHENRKGIRECLGPQENHVAPFHGQAVLVQGLRHSETFLVHVGTKETTELGQCSSGWI